MKRVLSLVTMAAVVTLVIAALPVYAQGGEGHGEGADAALYGAALYAEFCQSCHGPQGEAVAAGPAFAAISFEAETAQAALERGLKGDGGVFMPAYAEVLGDDGIAQVIAYMATWGTGETPPLPEPNLHSTGDDHALAGAVLYAKTCYGCHAAEGAGRDAEGFPAIHWTADSIEFVRAGGELGAGHAFGQAHGGPLSDEQLAELDTYAASWHSAEPEASDGREIKGLNVLLVLAGIAAILVVGGAYGTSIIRTET